MEEWTHEDVQELIWSCFLYISDWFLGLLGPISSCALEIVEDKTTFLLEWFAIPGTKEMDDCAVTVIKYLRYISAKDSGLSGNMGYINYPVKKAASVSPPAKRLIGVSNKTGHWWGVPHSRSTSRSGSSNERFLAGWGSDLWLNPTMVSIRFKWLELSQLLFMQDSRGKSR